jgi:hypothetical protein
MKEFTMPTASKLATAPAQGRRFGTVGAQLTGTKVD